MQGTTKKFKGRYLSGKQKPPRERSYKAMNKTLDRLRDDAAFRSLEASHRYYIAEAVRTFGNKAGEFWIKQERWAELVGCSVSTIKRAIVGAIEAGVLERVEQRWADTKRKTNNHYVLAERFWRDEPQLTNDPWPHSSRVVPGAIAHTWPNRSVHGANQEQLEEQNNNTSSFGFKKSSTVVGDSVGVGVESRTSPPLTSSWPELDQHNDSGHSSPVSRGSEDGLARLTPWQLAEQIARARAAVGDDGDGLA